ncbi:hypothetical protein [Aquimarina pacifica]|uniref:hypothetical protein n=1 Tax=Aquimarina pacifica TaxID=1296415 RepID=UPI0004715B90|nr:hypothetical protein [Aquimarina pacifica]
MKRKYQWALPVFLCLTLFMTLFFLIPKEDNERMFQIEIDELQRERKALLEINEVQDTKMKSLQHQNDSLILIIEEQNFALDQSKSVWLD